MSRSGVICAGDGPDRVTIARFRQGFASGVEQLFEQVLLLAARLGLGQLGVVALDGTKIAAPASMGQNRTAEGLSEDGGRRTGSSSRLGGRLGRMRRLMLPRMPGSGRGAGTR